MQQTSKEKEQFVSPFEEIKDLNLPKAVNILLSAASAAQRSGALSVRDSVLVAAASEILTNHVNSFTSED